MDRCKKCLLIKTYSYSFKLNFYITLGKTHTVLPKKKPQVLPQGNHCFLSSCCFKSMVLFPDCDCLYRRNWYIQKYKSSSRARSFSHILCWKHKIVCKTKRVSLLRCVTSQVPQPKVYTFFLQDKSGVTTMT